MQLLQVHMVQHHNSALASLHVLTGIPTVEYGQAWMDDNGIYFAIWGQNSDDTPYTAGLTNVNGGFQIGARLSANNQFWIAYDAQGNQFRAYYDRNGIPSGTHWSGWSKI